MKIKTFISLTIIGLCGLLLHEKILAAPCKMLGGAPTPIDITVPTLSVARDTPVGGVLATVDSRTSRTAFDCSTANNYITSQLPRTISSDGVMEVIDQSGKPIPGLGVRLSEGINVAVSGKCIRLDSRYVSSNSILTCRQYFTIRNGGGPVQEIGGTFSFGSIRLTFVKTSDQISSGVLGADNVWTTQVDNYPPIIYRITGGSRLISNPCTYSIPPSVPLGSLPLSELQSRKPSKSAPFQLTINCAAGVKVKINIAPTGGSLVTAAAGTITNSDTSTTGAQGVHVQLLDKNNVPVKLGTDVDYGLQASVSTFNFSARMVPSGTTTKAGRVTAGAVVTFTFH
ncbi:hypothetical protein hmeg3_14060 [Herbaspirillum sp. meg3]|uniref:fimbrial protein n=1 Tax=Herbaspirillum sp. meg3 TaxID=2025949 RepID=UPI000B995DC4|nr:fimbrial protein [Herbaspirillum sp. meg3]ASU39306.1 hypothetical protein hmeg3_14060 [Herbaspirillum sp. meg3]